MTLTTGRIDRAGTINFGDASISVWEEGIKAARDAGGWNGAKTWERQFKREVFARIVQTLNRLDWTVGPWDQTEQFKPIALNHRTCSKGDLKGELDISGRCIKFEMWQGINTPTRPDHGGRYESDKEGVMPYLLRIEMERTRRRIRDYLLNVFTGYTFEAKKRSIYRKPLESTAMERIQDHYAESWHFKGDWVEYVEKNSAPSMIGCFNSNRKSAEGVLLEHGQRVYFFDWHGCIATGTALYNINNMWWVVTGKYDYTNKGSFELYTRCPENPRIKRNAKLRRRRLEAELAKATEAMKFERAAVLRDILFPGDPQLYVVWHKDHKAYHCAGFCGYTSDKNKAGKFTAEEVRGWDHEQNQIISLGKLKEAA